MKKRLMKNVKKKCFNIKTINNNKKDNMKHITKILFVAITSLSLMFTAQAGELTVNGTAKATYLTTQGQQADNGIGITNELNFTASGEMDNGYTWNYSMELDPTTKGDTAASPTATQPGGALNDDTQISLKMNEMGTIKICVSECGNNKKYAFDASAYTQASDTGLSEGITYPADEGSYATIQYHTPELPYGTTASIAHGNEKVDGQSGNAQGPAGSGDSDSATFYSLVTKPIDGLTVSGSYYTLNDYANGLTDSAGQKEEGGAYAAKYAYGNVTVGYGKSYKANESTGAVNTAGATTVEWVENTGMSVAYAINDDLSVSYSDEESEVNYYTRSTASYDIEMQSIQLAYSLGGATLSVARTDYENVGYVQGIDMSDNIIALTFAF
ncbi:porin [Pelagibacteraceae bacterium]|nr:porin [Pelagibacteraceae bacterium]